MDRQGRVCLAPHNAATPFSNGSPNCYSCGGPPPLKRAARDSGLVETSKAWNLPSASASWPESPTNGKLLSTSSNLTLKRPSIRSLSKPKGTLSCAKLHSGETPWEARLWLRILEARELNFFVQGEQVTVDQSNGVRLFAAEIRETLDTTIAAVQKGAGPHTGKHPALEPPPHTGGAFIDDTYIWGQSPEYVQALLSELNRRLHLLGLKVNPKKPRSSAMSPMIRSGSALAVFGYNRKAPIASWRLHLRRDCCQWNFLICLRTCVCR